MTERLRLARSIQQMDDLKARMRFLRRLDYLSEDNVMQTKGRVACAVSDGDEILMTELMFAGWFNNLSAEQLVALASCVVCEEKVCRSTHCF